AIRGFIMIISLLKDYGVSWMFNRALYSTKLKVMKKSSAFEKTFEKKVEVKKVLNFDLDVQNLEIYLQKISTEKKQEAIQLADNAIKGKIKAFNSIDLDYGYPIKWNYNPITNVEVNK